MPKLRISAEKHLYRADIGGLRAIAVAVVVLYHFGVPGMGGGFLGVDVFFVLSGFLMTQIILSGLSAGSFCFADFMWARCRRIVPALTAMVFCVTAAGWLLVEPLTYAGLAKAGASSVAFVSNFLYLSQVGYFARGSEENWFLHTWSLSLEWQFYVVYPLFLVLMSKWGGGRHLRASLIFLTLASFSLCVWMSSVRVPWAFYLLPFRAWELIAGGLVSIYGGGIKRGTRFAPLLEFLGLSLVVGAALTFRTTMQWPSFWAGLPVIGSMGVLAANRGDRSLLSAGPFQSVGRWSYSIYLWHWPIIVGLRYYDVLGAPWAVPVGICLSGLLGFLSFTWVERYADQTFRRMTSNVEKLTSLSLPACVVVASLAILAFSGIPQRSAKAVQLEDTIEARRDWEFPQNTCEGFLPDGKIRTCSVGDSDGPRVLLIGDSEAQEWFPRYQRMGAAIVGSLEFATRAGCPPVLHIDRSEPGHRCTAFVDGALALAEARHYSRIVLLAAWSGYFGDPSLPGAISVCRREGSVCRTANNSRERSLALTDGLRDEIVRLVSGGSEVTVVLPLPTPGFDLPGQLAKSLFGGWQMTSLYRIELSSYYRDNAQIRGVLIKAAREGGGLTFDPIPFMCGQQDCAIVDGREKSLYKDGIHLRPRVVAGRFDFLDSVLVMGSKLSSNPQSGGAVSSQHGSN